MLYLFFILILVVEQAMAVHLSYHSSKAADQAGTFKVYCQLHPAHKQAELVVS